MSKTSGFDAALVMAFLEAHGQRRTDGLLWELNDHRVQDWERTKVARWATLDVVPLGPLDAFLMRHDLMLWELEHWCREHFGRDGFVDPYEESGLAA